MDVTNERKVKEVKEEDKEEDYEERNIVNISDGNILDLGDAGWTLVPSILRKPSQLILSPPNCLSFICSWIYTNATL
jgi:hypothetical protein